MNASLSYFSAYIQTPAEIETQLRTPRAVAIYLCESVAVAAATTTTTTTE
jgi:hypothetical protein